MNEDHVKCHHKNRQHKNNPPKNYHGQAKQAAYSRNPFFRSQIPFPRRAIENTGRELIFINKTVESTYISGGVSSCLSNAPEKEKEWLIVKNDWLYHGMAAREVAQEALFLSIESYED